MSAQFICRGFACQDRAATEISQTPKDLRNHYNAASANKQRNHLHMGGLREQSPYVLFPYVFFLLFFLASLAHLHAADDIVVRTHITPDSVWVGQRMTLQIDVLGKDGWAQITDLATLEIPNCYLLPSGNSRVRLQEQIDGADYSGQRYELSLYPQRNGSIIIPALSLPVKIQTWGAGAGTEAQIVSTKPRTIDAKLPAGVPNVQSFVAASKFTVTQTWSSNADDFTVGDALKRSIQLSADNLPAMLLPTIAYPEIEHLSCYPETPELRDATKQSTPIGQRNESITYIFESNGTAELPTYSFQWWNPSSETLQTITLPGRSVQLSGGAVVPPETENHTKESAHRRSLKYAYTLLTIIIATLSYWCLQRHRAKQLDSQPRETVLFKQLNALPHTNPEILQHTLVWVDCLTAGHHTLSDFLNTCADTATQEIAANLLRDPTQTIDLTAFKSGLCAARRDYLKAQTKQRRTETAERLLPPLNG